MPFNNTNQFVQRVVTINLVSASLTIDSSWGVVAFSVLNKRTSTTNGTVNGGTTIGELESQDIQILAGGERHFSATENFHFDGVVITSPAGTCELEVILLVGANT